MTRDQKILAIWIGAAVVVLGAAGTWLSSRGAELEARRAQADRLHADYRGLYPEQGQEVREALAAATRLREHQEQERGEAERALLAVLPDDYQVAGINEASAKVRNDIAALRQREKRENKPLPTALPFENGLDAAKVGVQLAQLHLYRTALEVVMDAGVTRVTLVKEGTPVCDPDGRYAVIPCDIAVEGSESALAAIQVGLLRRHEAGIGLRELRLTQDGRSAGATATLTVTLLTANNPQWQLQPEARPAASASAPAGGAATPAKPSSRGRLSGSF